MPYWGVLPVDDRNAPDLGKGPSQRSWGGASGMDHSRGGVHLSGPLFCGAIPDAPLIYRVVAPDPPGATEWTDGRHADKRDGGDKDKHGTTGGDNGDDWRDDGCDEDGRRGESYSSGTPGGQFSDGSLRPGDATSPEESYRSWTGNDDSDSQWTPDSQYFWNPIYDEMDDVDSFDRFGYMG